MKIWAAAIILLLFVSPLHAETVDISSKLKLHFDVPAGWISNLEPPQHLIDEMAEHIKHDAEQKGRHPSADQLIKAARKRFEINEALLYNPKTYSFLSLDFSSLRQGEREPSLKSIKLSARYAGESLKNEEGVSNLTTKSSDFVINGARYVHRFDSTYDHHNKAMAFVGVVGYVPSYWFYFYYTDYLLDEADREKAEQVLKSIRLEMK